MINIAIDLMGDAYTAGIHLYDDLHIHTWIVLGSIIYPFYLFWIWEEKGGDAVIDHVRFLMEGVQFFIGLFLSIAQFVFNLIFNAIERIPIIE